MLSSKAAAFSVDALLNSRNPDSMQLDQVISSGWDQTPSNTSLSSSVDDGRQLEYIKNSQTFFHINNSKYGHKIKAQSDEMNLILLNESFKRIKNDEFPKQDPSRNTQKYSPGKLSTLPSLPLDLTLIESRPGNACKEHHLKQLDTGKLHNINL